LPPKAEGQKHEGVSIVAFVTARKARGLKQTIKSTTNLFHGSGSCKKAIIDSIFADYLFPLAS
jgi:hypothetical protein